jgi:peptidoglycan/xylan/chitin deacetylase (PgdA/CDA1 family)
MRIALLTVDLEPDWGIAGSRALQEVTPTFVRFLELWGFRATFFTVASLAELSLAILAPVAERNEIASHGWSHQVLTRLGKEGLEREVSGSKGKLERLGHKVNGFRAPFSRCSGHILRQIARAGYRYDGSFGSVFPGFQNAYMSALKCPHTWNDLVELPTDAMALGTMPLPLTYLRLTWPAARKLVPAMPRMLYLHLHEFLEPETACGLGFPLRCCLTRNCGGKAWDTLSRVFDQWDVRFTSCKSFIDEELEGDRCG